MIKLNPILNKIKALATPDNRTNSNKKEEERLGDKFASLKYWTPEMIEWIGKETDPVKLAVASCLINAGEWPEWLPGKPEGELMTNVKIDGIRLFYDITVIEMLQEKSEAIAPGLYEYIRLTGYYRGIDFQKKLKNWPWNNI